MTPTVRTVFLLIGLVCLFLASIRVNSPRIDLTAAGLFFGGLALLTS